MYAKALDTINDEYAKEMVDFYRQKRDKAITFFCDTL